MKRLLPLAGLLCAIAGAAPAGAQPAAEPMTASPKASQSPPAQVPAAPHDLVVDVIVTESRMLTIARSA